MPRGPTLGKSSSVETTQTERNKARFIAATKVATTAADTHEDDQEGDDDRFDEEDDPVFVDESFNDCQWECKPDYGPD